MTEENDKQSKGGKARAEKLSPERRKEIARLAAENRWSKELPQASHEGSIPIGASEISCAIVGETRVITQATFLRAMGRARSPKAGTGVLANVDELPFFLSSKAFEPFISKELIESTKPIFFRTKSGGKGVGYNAHALPETAEVYLRFRDEQLALHGSVPERYQKMVMAADAITRALARVGIIALVDEATGYQDVRARDALAKIFTEFLAAERQKWVTTFPLDFYKELYRLRGWKFEPWNTKRPSVVANWTDDFVYDRLAPGLTEELIERVEVEKADADDPGQEENVHGLPDVRPVGLSVGSLNFKAEDIHGVVLHLLGLVLPREAGKLGKARLGRWR